MEKLYKNSKVHYDWDFPFRPENEHKVWEFWESKMKKKKYLRFFTNQISV